MEADVEYGGYKVEVQAPVEDPQFMEALSGMRQLEIKAAGKGVASAIRPDWIKEFIAACTPSIIAPRSAAKYKAADAIKGLSGAWTGFYVENGSKTPFTISLTARGSTGEFGGTSHEPNQTGQGGPIEVGALIHGYVQEDGSLTFDKTYDGVRFCGAAFTPSCPSASTVRRCKVVQAAAGELLRAMRDRNERSDQHAGVRWLAAISRAAGRCG